MRNIIKFLTNISINQSVSILFFVVIWIVYTSFYDISRDGMLYIKQAHYFNLGNIHEGLKIYDWPFFPFLLSIFCKVTNIPILISAQIINIFLFLVSFFYFLKILTFISKDKIIFPGFLVVLTSIPLLDDYLSMVLRDNGSWAGFTAGVYYFLLWSKEHKFKYSIYWQISFFISALFRIESLIFLLFLPAFSYFFNDEKDKKFYRIISEYFVLLATIVIFFISLIFFNNDLELIYRRISHVFFIRPVEFIFSIFNFLNLESSNSDISILIHKHNSALKFYLISHALLFSWFSGLKILHFVTAFIAIQKKIISNENSKPILIIFGISFLIPTLFGFSSYDFSGRYWMNNWWIVYIFSAFGLRYLIKNINTFKYNKSLKTILTITIFVYIFSNLFDTTSHNFERYDTLISILNEKH